MKSHLLKNHSRHHWHVQYRQSKVQERCAETYFQDAVCIQVIGEEDAVHEQDQGVKSGK